MDMRIRPTMPGLSIKTWACFVNKGLNKPIIKMQHGKYLFFWIRVVSNIDLNLPPVLYFISVLTGSSRPVLLKVIFLINSRVASPLITAQL